MTWLKTNWRWALLNITAVSVVAGVLTQGNTNINAIHTFDPGLASGKWAIRFLLICLAMTPMNSYFNWRWAIKLRKPAGLWAFGFAGMHLYFYLTSDIGWNWLSFSMQFFIVLGLLGMVILTLLAMTSNRWAMRRLKKNWKRLHRLVYFASLSVAFHAILATSASKKLLIRDPQAINELRIYLVLLIVLLAVRIPLVRNSLR